MAETASLRPVVAEILDGLSEALPSSRLFYGAETLRWAHEYDEPVSLDAHERAELDHLRSSVERIENLVANVQAKTLTPFRFCRAVAEVLDD